MTTPPPTADGTTIHNTATIAADNANTKQASADVTLNVPSTLDASTTKSISPAGGPNTTTATTTASVTGKNTSNVPVKQLTISDPIPGPNGNPPTTDNPLSVLEIQGLDPANPITYPTNAETAQVRAYDSSTGQWVDGPVVTKPANPTLPGSVDPANVTGVQLIFTSTDDPEIQPGESGGVNVVLHLKEALPEDQLP